MKKVLAMIGLCGIFLLGCGGKSAAPGGAGELDSGGHGRPYTEGQWRLWMEIRHFWWEKRGEISLAFL